MLDKTCRAHVGLGRVFGAAVCFGVAYSALAFDYAWQGGDGSFSDPLKWLPNGVPGIGDNAKFGTAAPGTVTWGGPVTNSLMIVGSLGGNTLVLDLAGNSYTLTNRFYFESDKASSTLVVSNGYLTAPTNTCDVKINAGVSPALLTFASGAVATLDRLSTWRSSVDVQAGAALTCNNEVKIGDSQANSVSALTVSGGSLTLNSHLWMGGGTSSTSTLAIAGGSVISKKYFSIGDGGAGTAWGVLNLSGGVLETLGNVWIGNAGNARCVANVSGGIWTNKVDLEVAHGGGATAWLNMSGGEVVMPVSGRNFIVAHSGNGHMTTGTVSVTGGQITATNGITFLIANATNGLGRFYLGGSGTVLARDFKVGNAKFARGECAVTGGLLRAVNYLLVGSTATGADGSVLVDGGEVNAGLYRVAESAGSTALFVLSNGSVRADSYFYVGSAGTGALAVAGGSLCMSNDFSLGLNVSAYGAAYQTGGSVVCSNNVKIGDWGGTGFYTLSGGALTCRNGSFLVGNGNGSTGTLLVTGGTLLSVGNLTVANNGQGKTKGVVVMTGGEVVTSNALTLASSTNTVGEWLSGGGSLTANALTVGGGCRGSMALTNGTVLSRGNLTIGSSATGTGTLSVAGGSLNIKGTTLVGSLGVGLMAVSNGVVVLENTLTCGNSAGSTGTLVLAGGVVSAKACTVGSGGPADALFSGGSNTFAGSLTVGVNTQGVLLVSGGSNTVYGDVLVARNSSTSSGRLTVSGGQTYATGYTDVGQFGQGVLEVAGGEYTARFLRMNSGSVSNPVPPQSEIRVTGGRLQVNEACYMPDTGSITGRLTLAGGVLAVPELRQWWGKLHVRFDGGAVQPTKNIADFINNLDFHCLTGRGLVLDTAGFAVGTALALPDAAGERGRLVKKGAGTFTLNAATTFTGPVIVQGGALALGAGGLITLADGCEVDGGALLNLSARSLDFTLPAGTASRVDGELRLASGQTLTVASGATLGGTGVVGRVVFEAGATLSRSAAAGGAMLTASSCVLPAGAVIALTGYTAADLRSGIQVLSGASITALSGSVTVTLDGVPQAHVALRVSGGVLTAFSYEPGTFIAVY